MGKIYKNDIGTEIILDTGQSLLEASEVKIRAVKPSKRIVTWSGTVTETSKVRYVTTEGDWSESGKWKLQAYVELPTWKGHGESFSVTINDLGT